MLSAKQYLNGEQRWCLWFEGISPSELRNMPTVIERVQRVREKREKSSRKKTRELAEIPHLFGEIRQPDSPFVAIPLTTSENRKYIPIDFFEPNTIVNNTFSIVPNATKFHFGILTSIMHMTWMKYVCGRLESRFRYSNQLVYNNFPWPLNPSEKSIKKVKTAAEKVLTVRKNYSSANPADLYDPLAMPKDLVNAHKKLDRAVDVCYRPQKFPDERRRIEYLFEVYEKITEPLKFG